MTDYNGLYQTWKQWQIARQGDQWSPWYQISPCLYTGLSPGEAEYTIGWAYYYGWAVPTTETVSYGVVAATIGIESSIGISRCGSLNCHIPGNTVGQVWYQQHMVWADYQFQYCKNNKGN